MPESLKSVDTGEITATAAVFDVQEFAVPQLYIFIHGLLPVFVLGPPCLCDFDCYGSDFVVFGVPLIIALLLNRRKHLAGTSTTFSAL